MQVGEKRGLVGKIISLPLTPYYLDVIVGRLFGDEAGCFPLLTDEIDRYRVTASTTPPPPALFSFSMPQRQTKSHHFQNPSSLTYHVRETPFAVIYAHHF